MEENRGGKEWEEERKRIIDWEDGEEERRERKIEQKRREDSICIVI